MDQRRFVILDRDGTLNELGDPYITNPAGLKLLPGVTDGLRELQASNLGLVVVTNQAVVGRGVLDYSRIEEINRRMLELLQAEGVRLDGIYVCPHSPEEGCLCRKPRPGLVERASRDLGFDPERAFVIGDDAKDVELGRALGATTLLVRTGHGRTFEEGSVRAHYVVDDFRAAAAVIRWILTNNAGMVSSRSIEPRRHSEADIIRERMLESARVQERAAGEVNHLIAAAAHIIVDAFRKGGKVLLCGNGGSAADCQHMAAEFMNTLSRDLKRPALPAIALTTDTSFLTAFMNDFGDFEDIFSRQVRALGKAGDILIAISTSGHSPNVLAAANTARLSGMKVIALTGEGGRLAGSADLAIAVSSRNTQYIQETLLAIEHAICEIVERELFGER